MQLKSQDQLPSNPLAASRSGGVTGRLLSLLGVLGALAVAGYAVVRLNPELLEVVPKKPAQPSVPAVLWVAAAPGRVEPISGETRLSAPIVGRVQHVLVKTNEQVEEGQLLVILDDTDAVSRRTAAEAEAGTRKRERDGQPATANRDDVRKAEDTAFESEQAVYRAHDVLDDAYLNLVKQRPGAANAVAGAKTTLQIAEQKLLADRDALAKALTKPGTSSPNRFESALTAARADVAAADALVQKHRLRAPISGRVLQVHAKLGEQVAPSPEQPLIVMGDTSLLRVKAEVEERDVGKIKVGQSAFVRSSAYPGTDFEGKVTALAPSLAAPRIGQRGPRRPTDVEVLEVTIELKAGVPLLPGMRVDAFFRKPG